MMEMIDKFFLEHLHGFISKIHFYFNFRKTGHLINIWSMMLPISLLHSFKYTLIFIYNNSQ